MERLTYTPTEASEILGVSKNGVYAMIQRGELPTIRAGSRYLIPMVDLHRMLGLPAEGISGD